MDEKLSKRTESKGSSQPKSPSCYNCGASGHYARDCKEKPRGSSCSTSSARSKSGKGKVEQRNKNRPDSTKGGRGKNKKHSTRAYKKEKHCAESLAGSVQELRGENDALRERLQELEERFAHAPPRVDVPVEGEEGPLPPLLVPDAPPEPDLPEDRHADFDGWEIGFWDIPIKDRWILGAFFGLGAFVCCFLALLSFDSIKRALRNLQIQILVAVARIDVFINGGFQNQMVFVCCAAFFGPLIFYGLLLLLMLPFVALNIAASIFEITMNLTVFQDSPQYLITAGLGVGASLAAYLAAAWRRRGVFIFHHYRAVHRNAMGGGDWRPDWCVNQDLRHKDPCLVLVEYQKVFRFGMFSCLAAPKIRFLVNGEMFVQCTNLRTLSPYEDREESMKRILSYLGRLGTVNHDRYSTVAGSDILHFTALMVYAHGEQLKERLAHAAFPGARLN